MVLYANLGDFQNTIHIFDVPLNFSNQILSRLDSSHIQCGREGSGQSPRDASDDVVKSCWKFRAGNFPAVLLLVEVLDTTVNPKVDRSREVLDVGCTVRSLMLLDADTTGIRD